MAQLRTGLWRVKKISRSRAQRFLPAPLQTPHTPRRRHRADRALASDTYTYNPDDPTPSWPDLGGFPFADYPLDNWWRLRRDDVLVYTSDLLEEDLEITGHPFVVLHAASDCLDTDWHMTLSEVFPDGG